MNNIHITLKSYNLTAQNK